MGKTKTESESNFIDWLACIGTVLGFFTALVSFIINFQKWAQDPQTFRSISIAGFILHFLGSLWFAFKAKNVKQAWRWTSLGALYVSTAFYFLWVGTWIARPAAPTPTATPLPMPIPMIGETKYYVASEWHGDRDPPATETEFTTTDIRITYDPNASNANMGYLTIRWLYPYDHHTCTKPGHNLEEAVRVTVTAWGERGGEVGEFGADDPCGSFEKSSNIHTLTTSPQEYVVVEFQEQDDLSNVASPFYFSVNKAHNESPITFYLSDLKVEGISRS